MNDTLLTDLTTGLSNQEFIVHLQPKVELATDRIVGAEALVRRINQTDNSLIFPEEFISEYEREAIISHIDLYVLEQVCKTLEDWGREYEQIPISVNFSPITLLEPHIVNQISEICDRYHIDHQYIIIEITERVELVNNDSASALVDAFKNAQFKISLDDFGCAYSNIITLAQVEFDEVKIDKSLVEHLQDNKKNQIIVENVLKMCQDLTETETIAEGIEHKLQADILRQFGCTQAQGFYYSRPITMDVFYEKYIKVAL